MYPALEIIHILGIVVLVGAALLFDFRLLGFTKKLPIADMARFLLPWSQRGLILVIPSGLLLFITNAETLGLDSTFWLKMGLLILAALNALLFHKFVFKGNFELEYSPKPFLHLTLPALVSITMWIAVIICGRLLAY